MRILLFLLVALAVQANATEKQDYRPGPISWVFLLKESSDELTGKLLSQREIAEMVDKGYLSKGRNLKCDLNFQSSWNDDILGQGKAYAEHMRLTCFANGMKIGVPIVFCSKREGINATSQDQTSIQISDGKSEYLYLSFSCITPNAKRS
ncbi:MAG TPA: hypothetical protein VE954_13495 [Oligoflexus sp.]|uniref:hypothetical protein n=1 Tax=Oligoflexus sp. TaxID=1971216 RepID=UPI002D7447D5|nr:hypothetical protein [Oligoflexus sp.]HYX34117.1 hypothetical protein [Oligoflexus sp.]